MAPTNRYGWLNAASLAFTLLLSAGCTQKARALTTVELMEDPAALQTALQRCNDLPTLSLQDKECRNAREAARRMEELAPAAKPGTDVQFEKAREARRARDELERQRREALEKVDPYTMPLAPDTSTPPPAAQSTTAMAGSQPNG
ncbi:MAG TPA: EexN family lipoprotein [Steroidobacteraceae bacterium]|nr:EexN family lipoprotein [Steroidobacteraceae bacterium]